MNRLNISTNFYLLLVFIAIGFSTCDNLNRNRQQKLQHTIIQQANAFGQFLVNEDIDGIIEILYPEWVSLLGRDSISHQLESNFSRLKKKHIVLDSVIYCDPQEIITTDNVLQTTITQMIYVPCLNGSELSKSSVVTISEDKGKTWFFILENNFKELQKSIPVLSNQLHFQNDTTIFLNPRLENTPENNFIALWNDFKINYPLFAINHVNWDSVYAVYYPRINSNTSNKELYTILSNCILLLNDLHCNLLTDSIESLNYKKSQPLNFINFKTIYNKLDYVSYREVTRNIKYGMIKNSKVGYIYVGNFKGKEEDYYFIDEFLDKFPLEGLIIDIRQNTGGSDKCSRIIASRFTDEPVTYCYYSKKIGPNYTDLSELDPSVLYPGGIKKYKKTIVLLTSRTTFSAAEDFTLMLKALPNVIHMGDATGGGVGTGPIFKTLPNGWKYRISRYLLCDRFKKPITNGIAPDVPITISKEDEKHGNDIILEKAIERLAKK